MTHAQPITQPSELDQIAHAIVCAKQDEDAARKRRVALENQLTELVVLKDEGTCTHSGSYYKISVTTGFTRKISEPQEIARLLGPEQFNEVVRTKYDLNLRALKALPENMQSEVARHIESKPKKASFKVEEI